VEVISIELVLQLTGLVAVAMLGVSAIIVMLDS
jgi:hypothetical protein